MSGAGRKVFQPGEVLTASNVQNYLMDQAVQVYAGTAARGSAIGTATTEGMISYLADTNSVQMATGTATWVNVDSLPIVGGTAERAALYPSPVQGNTVWRNDVKYMETYHTASGTAAAGWYSGQNGGLVPIIPTSVTVGSGSATVSENGLVTATAANKISLNGVFTSSFRDYKIYLNILGASASAYGMRLRASGTDAATASTYVLERIYSIDNTVGGQNTGAGDAFTMVPASLAKVFGEFSLYRPAIATQTQLISQMAQATSDTSLSSGALQLAQGSHITASAYDGFTFYTTSVVNMTGTIEVYGIRN